MLIEGLHYTCTCGCVREQINYVFAFVENMYCVDKLHLHSHLMTFIYRSRSYVGKKHVLLSSLCLKLMPDDLIFDYISLSVYI